MKTKFSSFEKSEYKNIRNVIKDFSKEETNDDNYSRFFRNDYYYDLIESLDQELYHSFRINLDQFFSRYRDKIYNDPKFTDCCGFLDIILYRYDKNYTLGGDVKIDPESRYKYGFQNHSLGELYLKQKFQSIEEFYNQIAKSFLDRCVKKFASYEIENDVENCTLLFVLNEDLNSEGRDLVFKNDLDLRYLEYEGVTIIFIGDDKSVDDLYNNFEKGDIEEWLDFEQIKKDIIIHQKTKKYNL